MELQANGESVRYWWRRRGPGLNTYMQPAWSVVTLPENTLSIGYQPPWASHLWDSQTQREYYPGHGWCVGWSEEEHRG